MQNDKAEIASEVLALSSHYPTKRLAPDQRARWLADYVDDIEGVSWSPQDARLACAMWRASGASKMPSPGELIAKGAAAIQTGAGRSALPITVPDRLHDDMAEACGAPFAGSYLSGATVANGWLNPKTRTARDRLLASPEALAVIRRHGLKMEGLRPVFTPEHKAEMGRRMLALAAELAQAKALRGAAERRGGETPSEQAERLWPSHRADRMPQ